MGRRFLIKWADTFILMEHCSIIGFGTAKKVGQLRVFHLLERNTGAVCLFHLCLWNTVPSLVSERRWSIAGAVCLVWNAGAVCLALFHLLEWNAGAVCLWENWHCVHLVERNAGAVCLWENFLRGLNCAMWSAAYSVLHY